MSPLGQDEYINYLVEKEIQHSRLVIETQSPEPQPDRMAKWGPVILGGTLGVAVLLMAIAVLVTMAF